MFADKAYAEWAKILAPTGVPFGVIERVADTVHPQPVLAVVHFAPAGVDSVAPAAAGGLSAPSRASIRGGGGR